MSAGALHEFQHVFSMHLRNPVGVTLPAGIPKRRARIYQDLVFNNICGFVDICFPVSKSVMPEVRWHRLCRSFFRDWPSHTPYFSKIPEQFVRYASANAGALRLPTWMPELLHYEWIELAVDTDPAVLESRADKRLQLNPTLRNLAYDWPVHRICAAYRPRKPVATHLLVYRSHDDSVRFTEINAITAQLLEIIGKGPISAAEAISALAHTLGHANPDALQLHGRTLLADLIQQQVLSGKLT